MTRLTMLHVTLPEDAERRLPGGGLIRVGHPSSRYDEAVFGITHEYANIRIV